VVNRPVRDDESGRTVTETNSLRHLSFRREVGDFHSFDWGYVP
jgi:hypothetical protein